MDMDNMKKIVGDAIEKAKAEEKLSEEEKAVADKAAKLIARDYGEVIKQLDEYERLEAEAEEIAEEDKVYRKKIVK